MSFEEVGESVGEWGAGVGEWGAGIGEAVGEQFEEWFPSPPTPPAPPEEAEQIETGLENLDDGYERVSTGVKAEPSLSQTTFEEVYDHMILVSEMIAPGYSQVWADINAAINRATVDFERGLRNLDNDDGAWKGETHNAAKDSLTSFFIERTKAAEKAANFADAMGVLVEAFENTILTTKENIVSLKPGYDQLIQALDDYPEFHDELTKTKDDYDSFAQKVMVGEGGYADNIELIAENNPVFTLEETQEGDPGLDDPNSPGGGGSEGFDSPGSFDGPKPSAPELSDLGGATGPELTDNTPAVPSSQIANPSGLNNPTDAMKTAADAARNGLGPATDAAKQAADGAHKPLGSGLGDPPEGVLGLGPKGLGDSPRGGGAGGRTGAGTGTPLPRSLADGRPTGAAVTSSTRLPSIAGATGAGPGMMGPPGAGAPTGAQRAGDNSNGHQVLKALRRKKNGQDVAGEADAVVAVLGAREKPAKPNVDQTDRADPPGTDVRPVTRGAHRPEQATQVQNP